MSRQEALHREIEEPWWSFEPFGLLEVLQAQIVLLEVMGFGFGCFKRQDSFEVRCFGCRLFVSLL